MSLSQLHFHKTGNGLPSRAAPRPCPSSPGQSMVSGNWDRARERAEKRETRGHATLLEKKYDSENDEKEKKLNLKPKSNSINFKGLVGILPKLWEKDLHRIITGWANEFGPVYKLRVMQFHVSREFFSISPLSFVPLLSFFELRRVSPLFCSQTSSFLSLPFLNKQTGHRHHRPCPGHARLPLQAA